MKNIRQVLKNVVFSWSGYFAQILITLVLTPIVLANLGETRYGLWTLLISITGYYGLLDIGFRPGLTQYLARSIATEDDESLGRYASSGFFSLLIVGLLVFTASIGVAAILPFVMGLQSDVAFEARACTILLGLGIAVQFPFFVFGASLNAAERFDVANTIGMVSRIGYAGIAAVALTMGGGLVALASILTVSNIVDYVARAFYAHRYVPTLFIRRSHWDWKSTKSFLGFGTWTSVANTSERLANYSDTVIIGAMVSAAAIAPYALAASLISHFNRVILPAAMVLFPTATKLDARGDFEEMKSVYLNATRFVFGLAVALALLSSFYALPFFQIWLNDSVSKETIASAASLFTLLAIPAVAVSWQMVGRQILLARRKPRALALLLIPECTLNVVLSVALAPAFGFWGVAYGTVISTTFFHFLIHPFVVAKVIDLKISTIVVQSLPRSVVLGLIFSFCLWCQFLTLGPPTSWIELFGQTTISSFIIVVLYCAIVMRRSERKKVYPHIINRFARKAWA